MLRRRHHRHRVHRRTQLPLPAGGPDIHDVGANSALGRPMRTGNRPIFSGRKYRQTPALGEPRPALCKPLRHHDRLRPLVRLGRSLGAGRTGHGRVCGCGLRLHNRRQLPDRVQTGHRHEPPAPKKVRRRAPRKKRIKKSKTVRLSMM